MDMPNDSLASLRRLRETQFARRFYDRLLTADREIARAFASTDFDRQAELFEHGLMMLLEYARGSAVGKMAMERLGEMHGPRRLDISPRLYAIWIDCVIEAARELDPSWDESLEVTWRADLEKGIEVITRAHARG